MNARVSNLAILTPVPNQPIRTPLDMILVRLLGLPPVALAEGGVLAAGRRVVLVKIKDSLRVVLSTNPREGLSVQLVVSMADLHRAGPLISLGMVSKPGRRNQLHIRQGHLGTSRISMDSEKRVDSRKDVIRTDAIKNVRICTSDGLPRVRITNEEIRIFSTAPIKKLPQTNRHIRMRTSNRLITGARGRRSPTTEHRVGRVDSPNIQVQNFQVTAVQAEVTGLFGRITVPFSNGAGSQ